MFYYDGHDADLWVNNWNKNKSLIFMSQWSHTGKLDFRTDWQMAVRRDNVISITLREVYKYRLS